MEKLSRVKKYEELRKQIDTNTDEGTANKIDPGLFKKMEVTEEVTPKREKGFVLPKNEDTFVNEYMDDLIRDVKQYNKEKGLLQSDITEIDILNQLKNPARLRREDYIQTIEEEPKLDENTIIQSKNEIAMQIQELLKEEGNSMNVTKVEATPKTMEQNHPKDTYEEKPSVKENDKEEVVLPTEDLQRLNEQTLQMQIKINRQEEEMNEISEGIDKTNRLLNVVLFILVVALFVVIGVTVYMILKNNGRL